MVLQEALLPTTLNLPVIKWLKAMQRFVFGYKHPCPRFRLILRKHFWCLHWTPTLHIFI